MEKTNKRIVLGMVDENGFEQDNRLYFRGGISPTQRAGNSTILTAKKGDSMTDQQIIGGLNTYPGSKEFADASNAYHEKLFDYADKDSEEKKTVEDYLLTAKDGEQYGVFKLTPRECGRLMGVNDKDIDKMFSVNSNSQCYKQYGNSIVVPVLMAIFSQLNIAGVKARNDCTEDEWQKLIAETTRDYEVTK